MTTAADPIRRNRDATWMKLSAAMSLLALIVAVLENGDDGPEGLIFPLLILPVATFAIHALVVALPWIVLLAGTAVGPSVLFFLGYAEGGLFFLCLAALVVVYSMSNRVAAAVITFALAAIPVVAGLTSHPDSGWGFWFFGVMLSRIFGNLGRQNTELIAQLDAHRAQIVAQATVEERQRIARDIHDLVGHSLTVVMLHITGARRSVRRDPDAAERALEAAEAVGRASLVEIRHSVSLLRHDTAGDVRPSPAAIDIESLVDHSREAGQRIEYIIDGDLDTIGPSIGLTGYRIVQEALANAARHAPEAQVTLELSVMDDRWRIRVENEMSERTPRPSLDGGGFGLISMRERVQTFGGNLVAGPAGRMWRVDVELPWVRSMDAVAPVERSESPA